MATNTAGTVARDYGVQMVHYLRKNVVFGDNGTAKTVGVVPAGALILKALSGVAVETAFNAGTTNTLNVGTSANDDLYGTLLALGSVAFVPCDEAVGFRVAADTTITATVVLTGTAATTGDAEVVIAYICDNDG
jgi:hypothetical protein